MSDTPPGWYDDPNNPGERAYWDGKEWAGPEQPDRKPGNTLAIVGVVLGAVAILAALAGPFGLPFAIGGLVIGVLAALRGRGPLAWVAVGLSAVGLLVSIVVTVTIWVPVFSESEQSSEPSSEATQWFKDNVPSDYDSITNNEVDKDIAAQMYRSLSDEQLEALCPLAETNNTEEYDKTLEETLAANGWWPLEPLFAAAGADPIASGASFVLLDLNVLVAQECNRRG